MPRNLPNDLFASEVARIAEHHLKRFLNGEATRDQVIEDIIIGVRSNLEFSMNTIAGNQGFPHDAQKLER